MWLISLLTNPKTLKWVLIGLVAVAAHLWHKAQVAEYKQNILNEIAADELKRQTKAIVKAKEQWLADGDNIVYVDKIITKYKTKVKYEKIEVPGECVGYYNSLNGLLDAHIEAANNAIRSNR